MEKISIIDVVGGIPFIDNSFKPEKLLGALSVHRAKIYGFSNASIEELGELIHPIFAIKFAHLHYPDHPPIESKPLDVNEQVILHKTIKSIIFKVPEWKVLIDGPFIYFQLIGNVFYSLTNPVIPQAIFSLEALKSEENLAESLVHELAHTWLGLINEIAPLADPKYEEVFTLPSGTKDKSTLGTLLAAHFAGAALNYHKKSNSMNISRISFLVEYLNGCINILEKARALTVEGLLVLNSLKRQSKDN